VTDLRARPLRRSDLDPDPLRQFQRWFGEAEQAGDGFAEAAALATATPDGQPSARMVLVKGAHERGFVFHTGYVSRKAGELDANPRAALLFYWHSLGRQVRIEGRVAKTASEESETYFRTRPHGGQLAAWASRQSEPIESREELDARFAEVEARFGEGDPPLPPHWGGYRLEPESFEFWQHRENRLHDRFRYRRDGDEWVVERLQP
jgi:pyridoxamine 5'-phosphate oxidase